MTDSTAVLAPSKTLRTGDDGEAEKRCSGCKEWWPADLEFFYPSKGNPAGLSNWCHACYSEWRNAKRRAARTEASDAPGG